jgi:hypothetical protein
MVTYWPYARSTETGCDSRLTSAPVTSHPITPRFPEAGGIARWRIFVRTEPGVSIRAILPMCNSWFVPPDLRAVGIDEKLAGEQKQSNLASPLSTIADT